MHRKVTKPTTISGKLGKDTKQYQEKVVKAAIRGAQDVALIAVAELASLAETAHLLRSPKNAERLLQTLMRAKARTVKPQTVKRLRAEVGLSQKG